MGEGASDGGNNKQPEAVKRHEGCLHDERLALGRNAFLSSSGDGGGKEGERGWKASEPRAGAERE